jgi:cytoplasmic iron level regulating protein YaaA (DUF328/UPF0246 family)
MLVILGPAKTIDTTPHNLTDKFSFPSFINESEKLIKILKELSIGELKSLMRISDKLADSNYERIAKWRSSYTSEESIQAILAFSGEVFNGLKARSLSEADLLYAQDHVRILSGLYGVLRPMDLILPYRLEMGTRLRNERGDNLYDFWQQIISAEIAALTEKTSGQVLINIASNEYFSAIQPRKFPFRIVTPVFKEQSASGFRNVTIYAKKARGMMLRFIIENRIESPEYLKAFDIDGYYYNQDLSSENEWLFCR